MRLALAVVLLVMPFAAAGPAEVVETAGRGKCAMGPGAVSNIEGGLACVRGASGFEQTLSCWLSSDGSATCTARMARAAEALHWPSAGRLDVEISWFCTAKATSTWAEPALGQVAYARAACETTFIVPPGETCPVVRTERRAATDGTLTVAAEITVTEDRCTHWR